jgi:hypothetical protein
MMQEEAEYKDEYGVFPKLNQKPILFGNSTKFVNGLIKKNFESI